jgi:hypothetical protein
MTVTYVFDNSPRFSQSELEVKAEDWVSGKDLVPILL